jgi:hypothetical protein
MNDWSAWEWGDFIGAQSFRLRGPILPATVVDSLMAGLIDNLMNSPSRTKTKKTTNPPPERRTPIGLTVAFASVNTDCD